MKFCWWISEKKMGIFLLFFPLNYWAQMKAPKKADICVKKVYKLFLRSQELTKFCIRTRQTDIFQF